MSDKKLLNETTIRRFWKLANLQPLAESDLTYLQEEEEELEEAAGGKDKEDKENVDEIKTGGLKSSGIKGVYDVSDRFKSDDDEGNPRIKPVKHRSHDGKPVKEEAEELDESPGMKAKRDDKELKEAPGMKAKRDDKKLDEAPPGKAYGRDDDEMTEMDDPMDDPMDEPGMEGPEEDIDAEVTVPESDVDALRKARDVIDQILSAADDGEPEMDMDDDGDDDIGDELSDEEDDDPMMEDEDLDEDMLEEMISTITNRVSQRLVKEALIRKLTK